MSEKIFVDKNILFYFCAQILAVCSVMEIFAEKKGNKVIYKRFVEIFSISTTPEISPNQSKKR